MPDEQGDPRVYLAGERTFLAWIRTGLAMMAFGFVVARLGLFLHELNISHASPADRSPGLSLWIGTMVVLLGAGVTLISGVRHLRFKRRFERREAFEVPGIKLLVAAAVILAVFGVMLAVQLVLRGT